MESPVEVLAVAVRACVCVCVTVSVCDVLCACARARVCDRWAMTLSASPTMTRAGACCTFPLFV